MELIKNEDNLNEDFIESLFEDIDNPELRGGLQELAVIMSLPDKEFNALSEIILEELNKSLNNPNDKVLLQQSMREAGYDIQKINETREEVMKAIDETLAEHFSTDRIDFLKRAFGLILNACVEVEGTAKQVINIPIEVMPHGTLPTYAHDGDAAMDIYSPAEYNIEPGETVLIKTGIKVAIPLGYALLIQPRSGQSLKTKLRIANTPGLIDSGYREEIGIIIENIENPIHKLGEILSPNISVADVFLGNEYGKSYHIDKGQRIAQLRLVEVPTINFVPVTNIKEIEGDRGGGFGSSGK